MYYVTKYPGSLSPGGMHLLGSTPDLEDSFIIFRDIFDAFYTTFQEGFHHDSHTITESLNFTSWQFATDKLILQHCRRGEINSEEARVPLKPRLATFQ